MNNTREYLITYVNGCKFSTIYEAIDAIPKDVEQVSSNGVDEHFGRAIYKDCNGEYFAVQGYYHPFDSIPTPPVQAFNIRKQLGYVFVPDFWEDSEITDKQKEELSEQVGKIIGL